MTPPDPAAPRAMTRDDVEIIDRRVAYRGFGRITELTLRHRRFAGGMTEAMHREVYERRPVAAVLLYDAPRDTVVLIEQFRAGAYLAGVTPWQVEIIAGLIDTDETPEAVARREAREEANCTVGAIEHIGTVMTSPGGMSELCTMFCGAVDSAGAGGVHGLAHEHEDIRVLPMKRADALAALAEGRIVNAKCFLALQWLALHHVGLRARWAPSHPA